MCVQIFIRYFIYLIFVFLVAKEFVLFFLKEQKQLNNCRAAARSTVLPHLKPPQTKTMTEKGKTFDFMIIKSKLRFAANFL